MRRPLPLVSAGMLAGILHAPLAAQAAFTQLSPTNMPSPRAGAIGVSDGTLLYHFGGKPTTTTEVNDMWVFDGTDWTDVTPTTGPLPPARDWYGACYDTSRGVYVLFGGRSTLLGSNLGDTWEFDGVSWTQRTPANSPSTRRWCAMGYDLVAGVSILFGGENNNVYSDETWAWDGTDWTLLNPTNRPTPRGRGRMSYDIVNGRMLYFGGRDLVGALGDTWLWNGTNWTSVATSNAPGTSGVPGRFAYGMTYDLLRERHVLFGGTRNGPTLSDVWEFDGVDWTQRQASGVAGNPPTRTGPTFAYVLALQKTILFGGFQGPQLGDTWEYQTAAVATVGSYGTGCSGPGGVLTLTPTTQPWTGSVWQTTCGPFGPTSLAMQIWGIGAASLPLALALPIAGSGCDLLNTGNVLVGPSVPSGGVATAGLPLPNSPALAGSQIYLQLAELQFDLVGNWIGLFTSNGLLATVGVR